MKDWMQGHWRLFATIARAVGVVFMAVGLIVFTVGAVQSATIVSPERFDSMIMMFAGFLVALFGFLLLRARDSKKK